MDQNKKHEQKLLDAVARFTFDPYGFVKFIFPWGVKDTPLEDEEGPDKWQTKFLKEIRDELTINPLATLQGAVSSGHGVGKSAMTAWIIIWAMSTRPHLNAVVTANTQPQLKTKTWRELATWHKRAINSHWFLWTATTFYHVSHPDTWAAFAIPNTEHNSESFAGTHAKHVLIIYDEASAIPDKIWEVTEGAMTTPGAMWFAYGNPTRNVGRFRQCWTKFRKRWMRFEVDAREAKMTNKEKLQEWVEDHGLDSDFVRVRVLGKFPRQASGQFISHADVMASQKKSLSLNDAAAKLIGVDVARFGDDDSIIIKRQGRQAFDIEVIHGAPLTELAQAVARTIDEWGPDATFVDGAGVGGGVVDILRSWGYKVIEVNGGNKPLDQDTYFNKRAEMWGLMREWLGGPADIPSDNQLEQDLIGPEYTYTNKNQILLEKKEDMKRRGIPSPDKGDALSLTFAQKILKKRRPKKHKRAGMDEGGWEGN